MKTYSEAEIEDFIRKALSYMPWPNGRPPVNPENSARFIVAHFLKKQDIFVGDDNWIRYKGKCIGRFGVAIWKDREIEWTYMPSGGYVYVISRIKIGD